MLDHGRLKEMVHRRISGPSIGSAMFLFGSWTEAEAQRCCKLMCLDIVWVYKTGAQTASVVEVFFSCRLSHPSVPVSSFLHPAPIMPCELLVAERSPELCEGKWKQERLKETVG